MKTKVVFVNPELCIGCKHCEVGCAIEHSESQDLIGMMYEKQRSKPRIHVEVGYNFATFPNRCRHCDPAPCVQVCPTGALHRDSFNNSVLVEYVKCIDCAMCALVCPFDIIGFHEIWNIGIDHEVNAKCDDCADRQKAGSMPACVEACKTNALEFGNANDIIRSSRKDFTLRSTVALTGKKISKIPGNIEAFRNIMSQMSDIGPF